MSLTDSSSRLVGQVKWFNNKAGYGFITVSDGEHSGKDIFIHFSTIRVVNSQYKYLIQGEYVEFTLVKSATDKHEYQATDVSGIKGGLLMCETRRSNKHDDEANDRRGFTQRTYKSPFPKRNVESTDVLSSVNLLLESKVDESFTTVKRGRPRKTPLVEKEHSLSAEM